MKTSTFIKNTSLALLSLGPSQIVGTLCLSLLAIKTIKDAAFKAFFSLCSCWSSRCKQHSYAYSKALKHDRKIAALFSMLCVPFAGMHLAGKHGERGFQSIGKEVASNLFLSAPVSTLVHAGTFPLNKPFLNRAWIDRMDWPKVEVLKNLPAQEVAIPTQDGRKIQGLWSSSPKPNAPVAILFHGNGMTASAFGEDANSFKRLRLPGPARNNGWLPG